jgi:hypothetical protein
MSNARYYARRAAGLCPTCGVAVPDGVYCLTDRERHRVRVAADRALDRGGYNLYARVTRQLSVATIWTGQLGHWQQAQGRRLL